MTDVRFTIDTDITFTFDTGVDTSGGSTPSRTIKTRSVIMGSIGHLEPVEEV